MPPQEPEPWEDIYPAVWWGNSAPQIMDNRYANAYASFIDHWNYDEVSEDCLKLNIWTPCLADGKNELLLYGCMEEVTEMAMVLNRMDIMERNSAGKAMLYFVP